MRIAWAAAIAAGIAVSCAGREGGATGSLDAAAESYVRVVLALGERDSDSLDTFNGPPAWQADARERHAPLADVRRDAAALIESLDGLAVPQPDEDVRRSFLIRQLRAVVARIDIIRGARPAFADEVSQLFGLKVDSSGRNSERGAAVRAQLDRLLPGRGDLAVRYAAFDRQFLIASDLLPAVVARAIEGCRAAARAHVALPPGERVTIEYVRELPWSAFTRYEGGFASRIRVNAALPLTVDRVLDLACHEAYPGHHTIHALLDARFGRTRPELLVQPLFGPQSLLHEAASTLAQSLAFSEGARVPFERDELFPLAGLDPSGAERHVRVGRLLDELHGVEADISQRYLDGALDFPRAAVALERDALMPSAETTLKFLNRFRSYAATYTIGRDRLSRRVAGDWAAYLRAVTDPSQTIAPERSGQ